MAFLALPIFRFPKTVDFFGGVKKNLSIWEIIQKNANKCGISTFWVRKILPEKLDPKCVSLEPQPFINGCLVKQQFSSIFYIKIWKHPIETTIYKWLFGVPGKHILGINLDFSKNGFPKIGFAGLSRAGKATMFVWGCFNKSTIFWGEGVQKKTMCGVFFCEI